jgi:CRP-like cAMP-binding protein
LQGNHPEGLHIVVSGRIKIFVLSPESGREVVLTTEHPYSAVAELPSLDGGTYPANAQALEDSRTLFLEQTAFLGVLRERPAISSHLIRTLGQRLRRLVGLVEQLSFQEVVHR